jgi:hypothetical protein
MIERIIDKLIETTTLFIMLKDLTISQWDVESDEV